MRIYARVSHSFTRYEKVLIVLFILSCPFANPWVRGDGVGYYAYIRALLIHHDLHFESEWLAGNPSFRLPKVDEQGHLKPDLYTATGHVGNHFTLGPAIQWAPFLVPVHVAVLTVDRLGGRIAADGYSWPYTMTMALSTALYGFLALFLAFRLARRYVDERWAFWGTLGIWFASALPVYMYLNPSWSHAHSAFAVALFLWYWRRTCPERSYGQWAILGAISGLMLNMYYPNAILLLIPLLESLVQYQRAWTRRPKDWPSLRRLFSANVLYGSVVVIAFLPTLVTRQVIYGSPFQMGYGSLRDWHWSKPVLGEVLFSSNHGLLTWTPILIPAILGLFWLGRRDRQLATLLGLCFLAYYYFIASYPTWDGISSFGNRFFVSLTPVFVLGLSASVEAFSQRARGPWTRSMAPALGILLIAWNLAFIFQWGTKMIPNRGPISWGEMARNQARVPGRIFDTGKRYVFGRRALMDTLEQEDLQQIMAKQPPQRSE